MMKNALFLAALNAVLVCADPLPYHYYSDAKWWFSNYLYPLPPALVQANESPTGSVKAVIGSLPYTLRVNVSEIAVANGTDANDNEIANAHVVATTLDLTYTGSHILNATEATIKGNSVARVLWAVAYNYDFAQSVLDNYDFNSPGDCSKPLGAACVRALEQHNLQPFGYTGLHISAPECSDTLGSLSTDVENDITIMSIVNNAQANATNSPVLWLSSGAFSGTDQTALDNALGHFQLIGITTEEEDTSSGETSKVTSVMCFRVKDKAVKSAAARFAPGMRMTVGLLTGFAVAWIFV